MRKKYFLIFLLCLFMMPSIVTAANASLTLGCPASAVAGSEIECKVNVTSDVLINGVSANYTSITGLTYVSFTPQSGFTVYSSSSSGFAVGNTAGKSGTNTIGIIKFKVNAAASFTLSSIDISDTSYKSYSVGNKSTSIRLASSDATLKALSLSTGSLSPAFASGTTSYNATVNASSVKISATANNSNATISGTGNKTLKYGKNTFKIIVTSEAKTIKTYTIVINRPDTRSTNNNLSSLSSSVGNISFNKNTTSYNLDVGANISSLTINATLDDSKASFVSGYGPRNIELNYGKNIVEIKVKSEKEQIKTYTLNINREDDRSTNNYLSSIELSEGKIDFNKDNLNYYISVSYNTSRLEIRAMGEDEKAQVVINNVDLVYGDNIITIVVTAENGDIKTYTINVKRLTEAEKMSDNNNVTAMLIFGHEYNFLNDVFEYNLTIDNEEDELLFDIELEDEKAHYIIDGNENLKDGSVVTVKVTSESGIQKAYKFNIGVNDIKENNSIVLPVILGFLLGVVTTLLIKFLIKNLKIEKVVKKEIVTKVQLKTFGSDEITEDDLPSLSGK